MGQQNWRLRAFLWFTGIVVVSVIIILEVVLKGAD